MGGGGARVRGRGARGGPGASWSSPPPRGAACPWRPGLPSLVLGCAGEARRLAGGRQRKSAGRPPPRGCSGCPGLVLALLPSSHGPSCRPTPRGPAGADPTPSPCGEGERDEVGPRAVFLGDPGPALSCVRPPRCASRPLGSGGVFLGGGVTELAARVSSRQPLFLIWRPVLLRGPRPGLGLGQGRCGGPGPGPLPPAERAQREGAQVGASRGGGWGMGAEGVPFVPATWFQAAGTGCGVCRAR